MEGTTLLMVADVCSAELKSIEQVELLSRRNSEGKKQKNIKVVDLTCVDDVRSLNTKTLVKKFSVFTADEVNRRFYYKCCILPNECEKIFHSYRSEKPAYNTMKLHLIEHLTNIEERIANSAWPPPDLKIEENGIEQEEISPTSSKRRSQHLSGVKMPSKRLKSQNKKIYSAVNVSNLHQRERIVNPSSLRNMSHPGSSAESSSLHPKPSILGFTVQDTKGTEVEEMKSIEVNTIYEETEEICGPLCPHTSCNYSKSTSPTETSQIKNDGSDQDFKPEVESEDSSEIISKIKEIVGIHADHAYYAIKNAPRKDKETKSGEQETKTEEQETETEEQETETEEQKTKTKEQETKTKEQETKTTCIKVKKRRRGCCMPPQFIIRTPPFPYVHIPLLPDCVSIEETIALEASTETSEDRVDNFSDVREAKKVNNINMKSFTRVTQELKRLQQSVPSSGSVLECVENRVVVNNDAISQGSSTDDDTLSDQINSENDENLQKQAVRQKAITLIAKLKSKKKKKCRGRLVECQICEDKSFTALATLVHHYRSHAGIKPYSCSLCPGTFTRKHSLKYHMQIHNNTSRFECKICFRPFRHPSHFKEHMRKHTGETPFECNLCFPSLKFKTRNTYKRHLKMNHKKRLTKNNNLEDY